CKPCVAGVLVKDGIVGGVIERPGLCGYEQQAGNDQYSHAFWMAKIASGIQLMSLHAARSAQTRSGLVWEAAACSRVVAPESTSTLWIPSRFAPAISVSSRSPTMTASRLETPSRRNA